MYNNNHLNNGNHVLNEIKRLKVEVEKYSWLFGDELSREIIESLEEKENDIVEHVMWLT